jgi:hypothetical protein
VKAVVVIFGFSLNTRTFHQYQLLVGDDIEHKHRWRVVFGELEGRRFSHPIIGYRSIAITSTAILIGMNC